MGKTFSGLSHIYTQFNFLLLKSELIILGKFWGFTFQNSLGTQAKADLNRISLQCKMNSRECNEHTSHSEKSPCTQARTVGFQLPARAKCFGVLSLKDKTSGEGLGGRFKAGRQEKLKWSQTLLKTVKSHFIVYVSRQESQFH